MLGVVAAVTFPIWGLAIVLYIILVLAPREFGKVIYETHFAECE